MVCILLLIFVDFFYTAFLFQSFFGIKVENYAGT